MIRSLAITLCVGIAGCGFGPAVHHVCQSDSDCGGTQVCFPEGCGDPLGGVVVEVRGGSLVGQLAQDFEISDGGFAATLDFQLAPATSILGEFQRNSTPAANPLERTPYTDSVTVKVKGESDLIPGIVRSYQATFTQPEHGTYSLPVGSGHFVVTALPDDPSIPPELADARVVPGVSTLVSFAFASTDGALTISGRLLRRIEPGIPPLEIALDKLAMDLQAFDPTTHRPLSQLAHPSTITGDFVLFVAPEAQKLESFDLVATPRDTGSLVPSKTFTMTRPFPTTTRLQVGDFGDPLPQLQGRLSSAAGPVAMASVYLSGPVNGGGTFNSKVVTTGTNGEFAVDLLPSAAGGFYLLTALPPPGSTAGVLRAQVKTVANLGQQAVLDPPAFTCPDKITVTGSVVRPDETKAVGTTVIAHAVGQLPELGNQPLPMSETEGLTDGSGQFTLQLDPGVYQIDFVPGEDLPRTSRVVTIRLGAPADGGPQMTTIDLKEFPLSKPRKVSGTITLPAPQNSSTMPPPAAVNATVRYFHVTRIEGRPSSLLLGEAVTDDHGVYSVTLPTH